MEGILDEKTQEIALLKKNLFKLQADNKRYLAIIDEIMLKNSD